MKTVTIDGSILKAKLEEINSEAAYILKPKIFESEYDSLLSSFKEYYNNTNIAYSFKTNYIPTLLRIVKNKNGYAEVVSTMELELALKVGFLPQNIFFNGPFKHQNETEKYLALGVLVNIDSYDEFMLIEGFAKKSKVKCRIGLRLNFNLEDNLSRFGISVYTEEIAKIVSSCNASKYLCLESLHYHYAARDLSTWHRCMNGFLTFLSGFDGSAFEGIRYISLGGGMFSRMHEYLEEQIESDIPSFNNYAEESILKLADFFEGQGYSPDKLPEVLIEPGTALASKALDFVVEVTGIKRIGDKTYINTTGSKYNMNPSANRINSPTQILSLNKSRAVDFKNAKLCGYTCIESDIIHNDFNGKVGRGDLIIFQEIGSYSVVMKPPFILPDVAIIEFKEQNKTFEVVRNRQTFQDIFRSFEEIDL